MQFYILTSNNLPALSRHFDPYYSNIHPKDAVVIINTLDPTHAKQAKEFCVKKEIEYHITTSDGSPAKGKNCLLDVFLQSENEYCVMVDGDDLITPHGVYMYKNMESLEDIPDALLLLNQRSLGKKGDKLYSMMPFTVNYDDLLSFDYITHFKDTHLLDDDTSKWYQDLHYEYYGSCKKYCQEPEAHSRVTWLSKRAAQFRFDEDIMVGEDTLQMLELKNQAVIGNLNVKTTDEHPATYIYDQTTPGTVVSVSRGYKDYAWMQRYLIKLKSMEDSNKLHENISLPSFKMEYPPEYSLGDYDLTKQHVIKVNGFDVDIPSNASQASIQNRHLLLTR